MQSLGVSIGYCLYISCSPCPSNFPGRLKHAEQYFDFKIRAKSSEKASIHCGSFREVASSDRCSFTSFSIQCGSKDAIPGCRCTMGRCIDTVCTIYLEMWGPAVIETTNKHICMFVGGFNHGSSPHLPVICHIR